MKNQRSAFSGAKNGAFLCVAVVGFFLLSARVMAQDPTVGLTNDGSTATINLSSSAGMNSWDVLGQSQLAQQWFWYSVNGGVAQSIDTIGGLTYSVSPDDNSLTASYQNATLSVGITYTLQGSGVGSGSADMLESISITNNTVGRFNINFYQFSNFNLLQNNQNTIYILGSPGAYSSIIQTTSAGGDGIQETIDNPLANFAEAGSPGMVMGDITNVPNAMLSNNSGAGPGNEAWAFEWTTNIDAGGMLDIYKDKNLSIQPVPEPAAIALITLGMAACGLVSRRRSS